MVRARSHMEGSANGKVLIRREYLVRPVGWVCHAKRQRSTRTETAISRNCDRLMNDLGARMGLREVNNE